MPQTSLKKGLIASDAISRLVIACALVMLSKKVEHVKTKKIRKKFRDRGFARGADRGRIALCEELGIEKEDFFQIALKGIQTVSQQIGL